MKNRKAVLIALTAVLVPAPIAGTFLIRRGFSARDEPSAPEILAAHTARRLAVPARAKSLRSESATTPEGMAEARANWAQNCALCHGANGDGQSEVGRNLYPKPPDLRAQETQSKSDGELYLTIQNGIRLSGMPAWGEPRDDDKDRWNLVALIRRLPNLTPEEIKEIEQYLPLARDPGSSVDLAASSSNASAKKNSETGNKTSAR